MRIIDEKSTYYKNALKFDELSERLETQMMLWIENEKKNGSTITRDKLRKKVTTTSQQFLKRFLEKYPSAITDVKREHSNGLLTPLLSTPSNTSKGGVFNFTFLTKEEEDQIVEWVLERHKNGHAPSGVDVRKKATDVAKKREPNKREFSKGWMKAFKQRHPEITDKIASFYDVNRLWESKSDSSNNNNSYPDGPITPFLLDKDDEENDELKGLAETNTINIELIQTQNGTLLLPTLSTSSSSPSSKKEKKQKSDHRNKRRRLTSEEEQSVVEWVKQKNQNGETPTRSTVARYATEFLKSTDPECLPYGVDWAISY